MSETSNTVRLQSASLAMQFRIHLVISALAAVSLGHNHPSSSVFDSALTPTPSSAQVSVPLVTPASSPRQHKTSDRTSDCTTFINTASNPFTTVLPPWTRTLDATTENHLAFITPVSSLSVSLLTYSQHDNISAATTIPYPIGNHTFAASTQTLSGSTGAYPLRTAAIAPQEVKMLQYSSGARKMSVGLSALMAFGGVITTL